MAAPRSGKVPAGAGTGPTTDPALYSVIPPASLAASGAVDLPNSARMVDFFLGGDANFEADRDAAALLLRADPLGTERVRANRAFAVRALRWCARRGFDQFLDLGCGIPSVASTHRTVQGVNTAARVAYVDVDPVAVSHAEAFVAHVPGVSVTRADLGRPDEVLSSPGVVDVLDLRRPVVVMSSGAPHWVPGDLAAIVAGYRGAVAPGSALVLSQRTRDNADPATRLVFEAEMERAIAPMVLRTRAEVVAAFDGFELVPPGVVDVAHWSTVVPRPDPMSYWGAIGLLPG